MCALQLELELDRHLRLAVADQVVGTGAGLAPEGPGHGVEEGALAVPVVAREAGDVDAREVERLDAVAVGEEVP
jgi:hypothetical protein